MQRVVKTTLCNLKNIFMIEYCKYCGFEMSDEPCDCNDWKDDLNELIEEFN